MAPAEETLTAPGEEAGKALEDARGPADRSPVLAPDLVAEDFGWQYRGRLSPALEGLTFRVPAGSTLLVIGPSGSGKSTLARALVGLVPHEIAGTWSGTLRVGDLDVAATPMQRVSARAGIVFQEPESQLVMPRVEDEVAFGLENRGWARDDMRARVPDALAAVGLSGFERRATAALSGGEQQRLAIADVLAPMPGLLVFDEPTANLDPPGMQHVFERIGEMAASRTRTLVIVEHRLDAALPLADLVLLIDDAGRQMAFGPPDEVGRAHAALLGRLGSWVPRAWAPWAAPSAGQHVADGRRGDADRTVGGGEDATAEGMPLATSPAVPDAPPRLAGRQRGRDRAVLRAEAITVRYPASPGGMARAALVDVSLAVRPGERVALIGPNGSGKSTLLFALAGVRRPSSGTVRVAGPSGLADPARLPARDLARTVGVVFQNPELGFVASTCAAEVAASLPVAGHPADPSAPEVEAALRAFGLERLAGENPFRLSEGEQRRLSIAAASIGDPAVLLLDEPTFGLDRRGADAVVALLDRLRDRGQAQMMTTHDPRLVPACDRVLALDAGRVVFQGSPNAFLADPPWRPAWPWQP